MTFRLNKTAKLISGLLAGSALLGSIQPAHAVEDWRRTVVFVQAETQSGQDMFIRGGLDHTQASVLLGRNCTTTNMACAIPIRHRNLLNTTTTPWKQNDNFLDWYGAESGQTGADGTAADWTTNAWPSSWGPIRTVAANGFGQEVLNTWGHHYWMLDVDMDCSKTFNGWFELKTFVRNGQGWEGNIAQSGTPYPSNNHFAQCGKVNKFISNNSSATFSKLKWNAEMVSQGTYRYMGTDGQQLILGQGSTSATDVQIWQPISNGQWQKTTVNSSFVFDGAVDVCGDYFIATSGKDTLVYHKSNGVWSFRSRLSNTSDWTSYKRNISIDQNIIALGKPVQTDINSVINIYNIQSNGTLSLESTLPAPLTGNISDFGKEVVVSAPYVAVAADGAAYVYERSAGGGWTLVSDIQLSTDEKIASIDLKVLSEGGPAVLAIAARGITSGTDNTIYVYEEDNGVWGLENTFVSGFNSWSSGGRQVSLDQNGYLSYITDQFISSMQLRIIKRLPDAGWHLAETVTPESGNSWTSFPSHMVMVNPDTILMSETLAGPGDLYKLQK